MAKTVRRARKRRVRARLPAVSALGAIVDVIPGTYRADVPPSVASRATSGRPRPARVVKTGWDRAITYRIYPTARQRSVLIELLSCQRELYNAALDERR